jgi:4-amino-4-deoxy-L-arabinose transferase-like glycosyltransferase
MVPRPGAGTTVSSVTTEQGNPKQWTAIGLLGLVAGLLMVFVVFRSQSLVDSRFDPYYFGKMGESLARGDGFLPFGTLIKRRAPLYPLLIGAIYWLFGVRPVLVLVLQCLLHAATCVLVYDLGRKLFGVRAGVLAALACALHPMLLRYVPDLHLETLFTFLFVLLVWLTERFYRQADLRNGLLLGAVSGLATLTKAVAMLYPGLFAGALLLFWLRRRPARPLPLLPLAALFVAMGLVIVPWTIRNYRVTRHLVPVSTGFSDAFLRGFIFSRTEFITLRLPPYEFAENEVNAYFQRLCQEAGTAWEKEDWETDQVLNREMKRRFFAEPALVVRKFFVGLFTFWYEMTSLATSLVAGGSALVAWLFALLGLRRARREGKPIWLLLLPILYLNLLLAVLLALGRYSAPVTPCLVLLAAYGLDGLLPRRGAAGA